MYPNDLNAQGCPLYNQSGSQAVLHFDTLIASLTPELRALFENERRALQAERDTSTATHSDN